MPQKQLAKTASNALIINKAGEILLLKRDNTGYCDGMYGLPAGHIDDLETGSFAMIRELKEEVNLDVTAENLKQVCTLHKLQKDSVYIHYLFEVTGFDETTIKNNEPHKCSDLKWVKLKDALSLNVQLYVKSFIQSYINGITYLEDTTSYLQGQ